MVERLRSDGARPAVSGRPPAPAADEPAPAVAEPAPAAETPAPAEEQARPVATPREDTAEQPEVVSRLVRIAGSIVAPTTLLTALLIFFGISYVSFFYNYFGVNATLLGLTTQDYLVRSVDGLFVPLAVLAAVGLLLLWGLPLVRERWGTMGSPRSRVAVTAAVGAILTGIGVWGVFARTVFELHLTVSPLSLASGVLLLSAATRLHRREVGGAPRNEGAAIAEWAMVFVLVGLSLFWVATDYSAAVGTSRARDSASRLAAYPDAVVFSAQRLGLQGPGIREVPCADPDGAYRFRYDGLKLVLQSGDQYLFLPSGWRRSTGAAILIPRSDSLRLEFTPVVSGRAPVSPRC